MFGTRVKDEESDDEEEDEVPIIIGGPDASLAAVEARKATMKKHMERGAKVEVVEGDEGGEDDDWEEEEDALHDPTSSSLQDSAARTVSTTSGPASDAPRRHRRDKPYLRVPNHDRIELIPGQKVMIPMERGQPLFGRATETEDEIRLNWRRVYVPDRFRARVAVLLTFQWICGLILAASVIILPCKYRSSISKLIRLFSSLIWNKVCLGRLAFSSFHEYMTVMDPSPVANKTALSYISYLRGNMTTVASLALNQTLKAVNSSSNSTSSKGGSGLLSSAKLGILRSTVRPDVPVRPDLHVHDIFALAVGLFIVIGCAAFALWVKKTWLWTVQMFHHQYIIPNAPQAAAIAQQAPPPVQQRMEDTDDEEEDEADDDFEDVAPQVAQVQPLLQPQAQGLVAVEVPVQVLAQNVMHAFWETLKVYAVSVSVAKIF
jgi:hypothetical protein